MSATAYEPQIKKLEASSRKLGFTEEDVHTSLGSLITATHSYKSAAKDMSVAQDIARFKGVSLTDATKMLTMAMTGSQRATKQLGINVSPVTITMDNLKKSIEDNIAAQNKNMTASQQHSAALAFLHTTLGQTEEAQAKLTDKQLTGDNVIKAVTEHLHGQAAAYAGTASGEMAQFKAQLNFLEISIGTALIPIFAKAATELANLTSFFSEHHRVTKLLIIATVAVTGVLLTAAAASKVWAAATIVARAATAAWTATQWLLNAALAANPIGAVVVAIAALVAALVVLQVKYHGVTEAVNFLRSHFYLLLAVPVVGWALAAAAAMINNWDRIKASVGAAADAVANSIMGVVNVIKTLVNWVMAAVHAVEALIHALESIHVPHIHLPKLGILGHASGGFVSAGIPSIVGERGPELFVPSSSGTIIPNNRLGGGGGQIVVPLVVDGTVLASVLIDPLRNQAQLIKQRTGKSAF